MTDEEKNDVQDKIRKAWNERPAKVAKRVCDIDEEVLNYLYQADEDVEKRESVNHPAHYSGDIECIDAMIQTKGVEKVKAFCELCAFKYLWRSDNKNGDEDIEKAIWYLNKYLELSHESDPST